MIYNFSLMFTLMFNIVYSEISVDIISNLFKDKSFEANATQSSSFSSIKSTIINPIYGYLFQATGALHNIRFFGPNIKTIMKNGTRQYSSDKSTDLISQLAIELFPSAAGILSFTSERDKNFGRFFDSYREDGLDLLTEIFTKVLCENEINYKEFKELLEQKEKERQLNDTKYDDAAKKEKESKKQKEKIRAFLNIVKICSEVNNSYKDPNSIKSVFHDRSIFLMMIHSFVLNALDSETEVKQYIKGIIDKIPKDEETKSLLKSNIFESKYDSVIEKVLETPWRTDYFPYSYNNQPLSIASIPIFSRDTNKFIDNKTFSDCADIILLHICNCLLYDSKERRYKFETLNKGSELAKFYSTHREIYTITKDIRKEWSKVIQDLNNETYNQDLSEDLSTIHIVYNKKVGNCENEVDTGFINMMKVFVKIFRIEDHRNILSNANEGNIIDKLNELFEKISIITGIKCEMNPKESIFTEPTEKDKVKEIYGQLHVIFRSHAGQQIRIMVKQSSIHAFVRVSEQESEPNTDDIEYFEELSPDDPLPISTYKRYVSSFKNVNYATNFSDPFAEVYFSGLMATNEQKANALRGIYYTIWALKNEENQIYDKANIRRITDTLLRTIKNVANSVCFDDSWTLRMFNCFCIFSDSLSKERRIELWLKEIVEGDLSLHKFAFDEIERWNLEIVELSLDKVEFGQIFTIFLKLEAFKNLKNLKIHTSDILSLGIAENISSKLRYLKHLTSLTLKIDSAEESEKPDLIYIITEKLNNLTHLSLQNNALNSTDVNCIAPALKNLESLTHLNLLDNYLGSEGEQLIASTFDELRKLTHLSLQNNSINENGAVFIAPALKKLENLTHLNLSDNPLKLDGLKHITTAFKELRSLTHLILQCNSLQEAAIEHFASKLNELESLNHLDLQENNLPSKSLQPIISKLKGLDSLFCLDIRNNIIEKTEINSLIDLSESNQNFYAAY